MVHRDGCAPDPAQWQEFLGEVDQRIANAIDSYRRAVGGLTGRDYAEAYRTLAFGEPGQPDDPDYSLKAVPVAYALRFAPQRMTTVLSAH